MRGCLFNVYVSQTHLYGVINDSYFTCMQHYQAINFRLDQTSYTKFIIPGIRTCDGWHSFIGSVQIGTCNPLKTVYSNC